MAAKKADYGCHVKKGNPRKGCGGGAKVVDLEKRVKKIESHINKGTPNRPHTEAEKKAHGAGSTTYKGRKGKKK